MTKISFLGKLNLLSCKLLNPKSLAVVNEYIVVCFKHSSVFNYYSSIHVLLKKKMFILNNVFKVN